MKCMYETFEVKFRNFTTTKTLPQLVHIIGTVRSMLANKANTKRIVYDLYQVKKLPKEVVEMAYVDLLDNFEYDYIKKRISFDGEPVPAEVENIFSNALSEARLKKKEA